MKLKSWKVNVRRAEQKFFPDQGEYYNVYDTLYIVAYNMTSARWQAKAMAGYSGEDLNGTVKNVTSCEMLVEF